MWQEYQRLIEAAGQAFAIAADVSAGLRALTELAHAVLEEAFDIAPGLTLVTAAIVALPCLSLMALIIRMLVRHWPRAVAHAVSREPVTTRTAEAVLTLAGRPGIHLTPSTQMIRIGAADDNEVVLEGARVDRYHALIHRDDEARWHVMDVSDGTGDGIGLNGRRVSRAALSPGDAMDVGGYRLEFVRITTQGLPSQPSGEQLGEYSRSNGAVVR